VSYTEGMLVEYIEFKFACMNSTQLTHLKGCNMSLS